MSYSANAGTQTISKSRSIFRINMKAISFSLYAASLMNIGHRSSLQVFSCAYSILYIGFPSLASESWLAKYISDPSAITLNIGSPHAIDVPPDISGAPCKVGWTNAEISPSSCAVHGVDEVLSKSETTHTFTPINQSINQSIVGITIAVSWKTHCCKSTVNMSFCLHRCRSWHPFHNPFVMYLQVMKSFVQ